MLRFINSEDNQFINFVRENEVKVDNENKFLLNGQNYQLTSNLLYEGDSDVFGLRRDGLTTSICMVAIYKAIVKGESTILFSINNKIENEIVFNLKNIISANGWGDVVKISQEHKYGIGISLKSELIDTYNNMVFDCYNFIRPERLNEIHYYLDRDRLVNQVTKIKKCYSVDLWRALPDFEEVELTEILI